MSERNDNKAKKLINNNYRKYTNVLIFNYNELLETDKNDLNNIINNAFNKFMNFIPKELIPEKSSDLIKEDMKKRIIRVNETVIQMKDKSFEIWDNFTGIHGGHRNRKG